jgi:hypothetical protein
MIGSSKNKVIFVFLFLFVLLACITYIYTCISSRYFDKYYIVAFSWGPKISLSGAKDEQNKINFTKQEISNITDSFRKNKLILHGLWIENMNNTPLDYCKDEYNYVTDDKLKLHQWQKHGTCSGLSPDKYFKEFEKQKQNNSEFIKVNNLLQKNKYSYVGKKYIDDIFNHKIYIKSCDDCMLTQVEACYDINYDGTVGNIIDCPHNKKYENRTQIFCKEYYIT